MVTSWIGRERIRLLACSVGALCLVACGGQEFSSNGSGGTSGSGTAGSKTTGGGSSGATGGSSGGDEAMGGSPDTGGNGGMAGTVSTGCDCGPGQYCRDASNDCFECTELSRLRFSAPERLDTLSSANQESHFPRVGEGSTDLLYSVQGAGLLYTTDSTTSAGSGVTQSMAQDSGPLLLAESVTGLMAEGDFNFAFDRLTEMNRRRLFFGQWQGGLMTSQAAPAPYNGGASDFSIAIATNANGIARAYWMTDRDLNLGITLVTALLSPAAVGGPVTLNVGQAGCLPDKADLSPWVTDDGKTLLFSTTRVDGNCSSTNQGKDLYTALLQPTTGQPTAPAVALADVNSPGNDVDPSFSADFCDLYFASDRDGDYGLYRARRH